MNEIHRKLDRIRTAGFAIGIVGLAFCCLGWAVDRRPFFISYLFSFLFWTCLSLGCLYGALIHYLTAGKWGAPARRFLEGGYMTLPLMALFVVPIFFGLGELYPWTHAAMVASDPVIRGREIYENPTLYIARSLAFFAIWVPVSWRLRAWSLRQDTTSDVAPTIKIRTWSGPAIALAPLTASMVFVDWAMTVEPDWYSSIFPVVILVGQMLIAIAFVIVMLAWMRKDPPINDFGQKPLRDLASLLLAFVLFWSYVEFSQVLLIYSANFPHEISWYLLRIAGDWLWITAAIALFHFFAPFIILLFRSAKSNVQVLAVVALFVFAIHAVEMYWVIAPAFYPQVQIHWTSFAAWFGIGGIWLACFAGNVRRHPLLARNDPRMENLIEETVHAK